MAWFSSFLPMPEWFEWCQEHWSEYGQGIYLWPLLLVSQLLWWPLRWPGTGKSPDLGSFVCAHTHTHIHILTHRCYNIWPLKTFTVGYKLPSVLVDTTQFTEKGSGSIWQPSNELPNSDLGSYKTPLSCMGSAYVWLTDVVVSGHLMWIMDL